MQHMLNVIDIQFPSKPHHCHKMGFIRGVTPMRLHFPAVPSNWETPKAPKANQSFSHSKMLSIWSQFRTGHAATVHLLTSWWRSPVIRRENIESISHFKVCFWFGEHCKLECDAEQRCAWPVKAMKNIPYILHSYLPQSNWQIKILMFEISSTKKIAPRK